MTEKISIVVPMYNSEKPIEKCVKSLVKIPNSEVIIVDDGSLDGSYEIVSKLSQEYVNLKLLKQENAGPSAARNNGMKVATGEYITFCDSDDYFDQVDILDIIDTDSELNVFSFNYVNFDEYKDDKLYKENMHLTNKEYIGEMANHFQTLYFGVVWNKVFKTEIIKKNNIKFDDSIIIGKDSIFNMEYLRHIEKVAIFNSGFCNHINDEKSLNHSEDVMKYFYQAKIRLDKLREVSECLGVNISQKYYNSLVVELNGPVKYIVQNNSYKDSKTKILKILDIEDDRESLLHNNLNDRNILALKDAILKNSIIKVYVKIKPELFTEQYLN